MPTSQIRRRPRTLLASLGLVGVLLAGCGPGGQSVGDQPAGEAGWLAGDLQQKLETIADQFGGFDQTMMEVGYRYQMLHWAGEDTNWQFAAYQIEEMTGAMERGLLRRPERKESAQPFMEFALPQLADAVANRDQEMFRERFEVLRANCNSCHVMEDHAYIKVGTPTMRLQPLVWP
jgi:hypothetical protein